jgi:Flp pilus assembly protein TadD
VLALLERDDEALAELTLVVEGDASPRQRYLAHLFRGAVSAGRGDTVAARSAYEAAMALAPGRQTALLAMSHLEETAGNVARARALLAPLASGGADDEDPWWTYQNGGLDEETLAWLRDYVRQ